MKMSKMLTIESDHQSSRVVAAAAISGHIVHNNMILSSTDHTVPNIHTDSWVDKCNLLNLPQLGHNSLHAWLENAASLGKIPQPRGEYGALHAAQSSSDAVV